MWMPVRNRTRSLAGRCYRFTGEGTSRSLADKPRQIGRRVGWQREELAMAIGDPVPFGVTVSVDNLEGAREFYTKMYPDYESMTEGIFETIKYFSLIGKDGEVLVNVLQKQAGNPIQGAIPMLKVDSVSDWIAKFGAMGGKVVIPQVVCPCTQTYFRRGDRLAR